jgi:hypothetical protein
MNFAGACLQMSFAAAEVHDFFGQSEDAGLAGDYQEAVGGIAAEPARPLETAGVDGAVETVPGQRIGNDASDGFHLGLLEAASG